MKVLLPIADDIILHNPSLEETKVPSSIMSSMRSFVNDGTMFRSIDF